MWLDPLTDFLADLEKFLDPLHRAEYQPKSKRLLEHFSRRRPHFGMRS